MFKPQKPTIYIRKCRICSRLYSTEYINLDICPSCYNGIASEILARQLTDAILSARMRAFFRPKKEFDPLEFLEYLEE